MRPGGNRLRSRAFVALQFRMFVIRHEPPRPHLVGRDARPKPQDGFLLAKLDPSRRVAVRALGDGWVAEFFYAEHRTPLAPQHRLGAAAFPKVRDLGFVLVTE